MGGRQPAYHGAGRNRSEYRRCHRDGRAAPVYYISPTQINALAPNDDSLGMMVPVEMTVNGVSSAPFAVALQQFAPGLFLWQARDVVATHTDFTLAMAAGVAPGAKPAAPGEVIILWGTGFGKSDPPQPVNVVPTVAATIDTPVIVHFGGQKVNAISPAMTPKSAGLYQVAVRVPDTNRRGRYPGVGRDWRRGFGQRAADGWDEWVRARGFVRANFNASAR